MKPSVVVVLVVAVGGASFAAGRFTSDEAMSSEQERAEEQRAERWHAQHPANTIVDPRVIVTQPSRPAPSPVGAPTEAPAAPADVACAEVSVFSQRCAARLKERESELSTLEDLRTEREGKPIAQRAKPADPRFSQSALTTSMQQAFVQSRVPGAVEGIDCSEYPCILFGRIEGGEDQMEKIEQTKAMLPYEDDILTVLLWTATDDTARQAAEARGEDGSRLEQSLFSVALYPRKDKKDLGDNLDRRIRTRTAELWNTTAPSDETAAR